MNARDKIYDPRTFEDERLNCPKCGWDGRGDETHVAGFYGIGKFKEILCPHCNEYLGNLLRNHTGGDAGLLDSQLGPI